MIKKILPKSVLGWIVTFIAGSWIAYFFMNAHELLDKLNHNVSGGAGLALFVIFVVVVMLLSGDAEGRADEYKSTLDDPAYADWAGNIYHMDWGKPNED